MSFDSAVLIRGGLSMVSTRQPDGDVGSGQDLPSTTKASCSAFKPFIVDEGFDQFLEGVVFVHAFQCTYGLHERR